MQPNEEIHVMQSTALTLISQTARELKMFSVFPHSEMSNRTANSIDNTYMQIVLFIMFL